MKKLSVIGLLTICIMILVTGSAKATVVTLVTDLINTDAEKVTVSATASDEVLGGYWQYTYDVSNVTFNDNMYGFQVFNLFNYTIESVSAPANWSFASLTDRFIWQTSYAGGNPLNMGGTYTFVMKTPISEGSIPGLQYAEGQDGHDVMGNTLSPVPEPGSLLLLGSGLLGLAAFGRAKRKVKR